MITVRTRAGASPRLERLVSALAMVIGFERLLVARDTGGLDADQAAAVSGWAARALLRAALAEPRARRS